MPGHLKKDWLLRDWLLLEGLKRRKEMQQKMCRNLENATFFAHQVPHMYLFTSLYTDLLIHTFDLMRFSRHALIVLNQKNNVNQICLFIF